MAWDPETLRAELAREFASADTWTEQAQARLEWRQQRDAANYAHSLGPKRAAARRLREARKQAAATLRATDLAERRAAAAWARERRLANVAAHRAAAPPGCRCSSCRKLR